MSGNKWKQCEIITEEDMDEVSDFARFMVTNMGYYFWDKKTKTKAYKHEIYITFKDEGFEAVYNDTQGRYCRKKK